VAPMTSIVGEFHSVVPTDVWRRDLYSLVLTLVVAVVGRHSEVVVVVGSHPFVE
jgi:hypothetical protein